MSPMSVFVCGGVLLLAMLCIVPIWNAAALIQDPNYVFWAGRSVPILLAWFCFLIVGLYAATVFLFFRFARPEVQTEQTIMMIAHIFISMLGLMLMLISLPLYSQSMDTYTNLIYHCDYSTQTHRVFEFSQVLHNIRRSPECVDMDSVEDCPGYKAVVPYTDFLKTMENDFRCSGFCYRAPAAKEATEAGATQGAAGPTATSPAKKGGGLLENNRLQRRPGSLAPDAEAAPATAVHAAVSPYPPTLFSGANYQASCEGMASRDMKNFAGDVAFQTFYQGMYLVLIAIVTGFLKIVGFCVMKGRGKEFDVRQHHSFH